MAEELKIRLTDAQIADLLANLPLADIIGDHSDHRLKEVLDEVRLVYDLSPLFSIRYEFIEIDLDGGASQVLEAGQYILEHYTIAPAQINLAAARGHIEFQKAAGWEDAIDVSVVGVGINFYSDGVNVRYANGAAPGTHYIIAGVRQY